MTEIGLAAASGLWMPVGVIQPFFLRFHRDDLHIMAVFEGHPDYEAVEAMIARGATGGFAIRAILTCHDQSQIDHVNDDALLGRMRGAERRTCKREIRLVLESVGASRRARLEFTSHVGEQVLLEVVTDAAPDPRGAGLTDPGGHSAANSLPLMWRGASALAGPRTRVSLDGAPYIVPPRRVGERMVGLEGYYTEDHAMGVIRAGEVQAAGLVAPERIVPGAAWRERGPDGVALWNVVDAAPDGGWRIEKQDGSGEVVVADEAEGRLRLRQVIAPDRPGGDAGLVLGFPAPGRFTLSMPGAPDVVAGSVASRRDAGAWTFSLCPEAPAWARSRAVRLACVPKADVWTFTTRIG